MSNQDPRARGPLSDPAIARAVAERMAALPADATPLQKHVLFFDRDEDGEISLLDTYRGSRALGFGRLLSGTLALVINGALGWVTQSPPRPTLRIDVARIHRGKHGSDTDIYNELGYFVPEELEETFSRFDRDRDGALSLYELWLRARGDRDLYDIVGQLTSLAEFGLTYLMAAENGKLSREAILANYDGSLFYAVEELRRRRGPRSLRERLRDWLPRM
jgi:peroxygenase